VSLSKVGSRYSTFLPTLSQSECVHCNLEGTVIVVLLSIIFNGLSYVIFALKSILHLVHCIHLVHLTLCWLSSSTLFVVLTFVDSITPKSYLCKLTVIAYGPLGHLLLSVTIPCRESKPIVRLVNVRLAFESVQLKLCSLGEAY
jgi:hypothetical protein